MKIEIVRDVMDSLRKQKKKKLFYRFTLSSQMSLKYLIYLIAREINILRRLSHSLFLPNSSFD